MAARKQRRNNREVRRPTKFRTERSKFILEYLICFYEASTLRHQVIKKHVVRTIDYLIR